jgi:hypothetical protein
MAPDICRPAGIAKASRAPRIIGEEPPTDYVSIMFRRETSVPVEILRQMEPAQKLAVAQGLRDLAWELTSAGIRARHPDLTETKVQERVRELFARVAT